MEELEENICAHIPCRCVVRPGEQYCSESCKDAGSEDAEIDCESGHATCAMTIAAEKIA